jgi:hypothetical protein
LSFIVRYFPERFPGTVPLSKDITEPPGGDSLGGFMREVEFLPQREMT